MFENKIIYDDLKDENLMAEIGILQFYNHDFTEIIQLDELLEYNPKQLLLTTAPVNQLMIIMKLCQINCKGLLLISLDLYLKTLIKIIK